MSTLLFTLEYPPFKGGVSKVYENLVKYWPKSDNIFVLDNNDGKLTGCKLWPKWLPAFWYLYKEVKKNNINHVIVGHILPLGTIAYYLSDWLGFKYSVIFHGMDFDFGLKRGRKKLLMKKILKKADKIICMNSYVGGKVEEFLASLPPRGGIKGGTGGNALKGGVTADNALHSLHETSNLYSNGNTPRPSACPDIAKQFFGGTPLERGNANVTLKVENKIAVINPGIEFQYQAASIKHQADIIYKKYELANKFVLFTVGRLVKRKGQDAMIKAMKLLIKKIPNIWYYIGGTGPDEQYLKELKKDIKNIEFLGKISEKEKWAWLSLCDIFTMPAREENGDYEGFGIVYIEANSIGKPVIAGRSGGIEDAVIDYETGILVDPNSADDIVDGIFDLYTNWGLKNELGENGLRRVIANFDAKKQVRKMYDLING